MARSIAHYLLGSVLGLAVLSACPSAAYAAERISPYPVVMDAVNLVDRAIFRGDKVEYLPAKKRIKYALLGYINGDGSFSSGFRLTKSFYHSMFNDHTLLADTIISIVLVGSGNLDDTLRRIVPGVGMPEVIAVFSEGVPGEGAVSSLLAMTMFQHTPQVRREDMVFFGGACTASHFFVGEQIERSIVFIDSRRIGAWDVNSNSPDNSRLPGACLLAGLVSHAGVFNIGALSPEEIIATNSIGERQVTWGGFGPLYHLCCMGLRVGMSRSKARQLLIDGTTETYRKVNER